MKAFQYKGSDPSQYWCPYVPEGQGNITLFLGYKSLIDQWAPWHITVNKSKGRKYTDFPSLIPGSITLSDKAYLAFKSMLDSHPNLEVLSCESDDGPVHIVNIWNEVDCFDRESSVYTPDGGDPNFIGSAETYVLSSSKLRGQHIFRIPEAMSAIFVSDSFIEIAHNANLVGLNLGKPIWSDGGD